MADSQEALVQGRTRWRPFGAMTVPAALAVGAIVVGLGNGAIATSTSAGSFVLNGLNLRVLTGDSAKECF